MPLACLEKCPMAKCRRFFQCEEHWNGDELEEMQPDPPAKRPDWVEPELENDEVKK
ncbi:MAG: hypothetical protein L6271_10220 [Desulfobacteraceae bacterium]|nr:hypothetical protein [Pseudomonadota bacterium]MCG2744281.1 hypothetical protein [Desulfobacteraceae bacterium]